MEPIPRTSTSRGARILTLGLVALMAAWLGASAAQARVLRVGRWHGTRGNFRTIQRAVDAAHKGDWILVGPGDYHERADYSQRHQPPAGDAGAGVVINTPDLYLRGMNRNKVIVDGTKPGSPPCSSSPSDQDFGPAGADGPGRNGIVAYADNVWIENLTACNFLGEGNQIWWNGGDGSGKLGMGAWYGSYLSATSSYYEDGKPSASYGEFASNSRGPGRLIHSYASNMNDAGVYIGACQQQCHSVVSHSHFQYSALGYSGTNAGGELVLKNSEWDHNATGIVTNSQNNDDAPSPQEGACPQGNGPTGTYSCTIFRGNHVHDNNNPHTPLTTPSPIGTGIVIAGGRDDTVMDNSVIHNGAWGILLVPYPDLGPPPPIAHCEGGTPDVFGPGSCLYDDWGNQVFNNVVAQNGFFGNPTNGDLAELSQNEPSGYSNCWYGNKHPDGSEPSSDPPAIQTVHGQTFCGTSPPTGFTDPELTSQVACDTGALGTPCPPTPGMTYPQHGDVTMPKLQRQPTMRNPCKGVPANPWCPRRSAGGHRSRYH